MNAVWTTAEYNNVTVHYAPSADGQTEAYIDLDEIITDVNMNISGSRSPFYLGKLMLLSSTYTTLTLHWYTNYILAGVSVLR